MIEHRWKDITGGAVDDVDWRTLRSLPTFGDGTPASLELEEITTLAPRRSSLMVSFEAYAGQGDADQPTSPTPAVTATLEVITMFKDLAGNACYQVGPALALVPNQRKAIEVESGAQGLSWVRITALAGALPDPGSIRVFVDEAVEA